MKTRFLHTADWHLGTPFAGVDDPNKCALLPMSENNLRNRFLTESRFKLGIECPAKLFYTGKEKDKLAVWLEGVR